MGNEELVVTPALSNTKEFLSSVNIQLQEAFVWYRGQ